MTISPARQNLLSTMRRVVARLHALGFKYSDDQPRDDSGRWSDGGGGGDGGGDTSGGDYYHPETAGEAYEFGESQSADIIKNMSEGEKAAFDFYNSEGYSEINGALRDGKGGDVSEYTKEIDTTLDRAIVSKPFVSYRGISDGVLPDEDLTGSKINDMGYVSTTLMENIVYNFGDTVIEIRSPSGSKALFTESLSGREEFEFLLPRGSNFNVLSDTYGQPGQRFLEVEVIK